MSDIHRLQAEVTDNIQLLMAAKTPEEFERSWYKFVSNINLELHYELKLRTPLEVALDEFNEEFERFLRDYERIVK